MGGFGRRPARLLIRRNTKRRDQTVNRRPTGGARDGVDGFTGQHRGVWQGHLWGRYFSSPAYGQLGRG
ncbi:hypothetical protein VFPFJ_10434 [Purpureocillium lilacinum]|uniref:Uncharacterized protein n=1 Tax=Purpureocillium lilacinum TaxID=33203 RepID=A0A179GGB2_PURLI|nr:hypothetical protein VFPFJ_10434 [Purpureocillium lilacinum]OAQ76897.1 hypothetical protein VFPFJ_10434 [Purpureocillium lilacinum]